MPNVQSRFAKSVGSLLALDNTRATAATRLDELWILLISRAFSGQLTAKWREGHMQELLTEMSLQAKTLNLPPTLEAAV